jgi:hypothetical protein
VVCPPPLSNWSFKQMSARSTNTRNAVGVSNKHVKTRSHPGVYLRSSKPFRRCVGCRSPWPSPPWRHSATSPASRTPDR